MKTHPKLPPREVLHRIFDAQMPARRHYGPLRNAAWRANDIAEFARLDAELHAELARIWDEAVKPQRRMPWA